eukprot:TRINITY_DN21001_c0_g1_i1.p1 TRINITY_DN21001_c0_g1~~TRINITY_DN21001_c0_g1_i1.p1  ORF type:complete len:297 (+),score=45.60 TRINITY_DN21001_c0_g1_i1:49-939(+)
MSSSRGIRPTPPFAVTSEPWVVSTAAEAQKRAALKGAHMTFHKGDLDRATDYIRTGRALEADMRNSPFLPSATPLTQKKPGTLGLGISSSAPGLQCRGGLASAPTMDNRLPAGRGIQGLPGRNINDHPGDAFPQASRGIAHGGVPMWAFERMPSLLQSPLRRDTVKRGVAGRCPTTLVAPPEAPRHLDPNFLRRTGRLPSNHYTGLADLPPGPPQEDGLASARSGFSTSRSSAAGMNSELRHAGSEPQLSRPPSQYYQFQPRPVGGMHGMIGLGWDDARQTAGDSFKGSGGNFLGQ